MEGTHLPFEVKVPDETHNNEQQEDTGPECRVSPLLAVQIVLKNEHGCHLVHVLFAVTPFEARFLKVLFCRKAREPFVPQDNRKT